MNNLQNGRQHLCEDSVTKDSAKMVGWLHSTDSFSAVDGPGIRSVVFMQGCLFRCVYCHNPDSWALKTGMPKSPQEVWDQLHQYRRYWRGGGITVSGGEPLLQQAFVTNLFKICRKHQIHTALDTNGYARQTNSELMSLLDNTDLVLLDIKHIEDQHHRAITGISNRATLAFARLLATQNVRTWIRYVIVPGYSDDPQHARQLAQFVGELSNVELVELLPYHKLGSHKWDRLVLTYKLKNLEPPSQQQVASIRNEFERCGLRVRS